MPVLILLCFSLYCSLTGIMKAAHSLYVRVLVIVCCCKAFGQHNQRPNIVIILADDLVSNV